jgi:hypothetical protein
MRCVTLIQRSCSNHPGSVSTTSTAQVSRSRPGPPAVGVWPGRKHHEKAGAPSSRIPVELSGFRELHAPFLRERRTRGFVQRCVAGIRGPLRSLQRVGYATVGIEIRGIPPFAKKREGWGTRGFVALSAEDRKCPVSYPAGRQRRWTTERKHRIGRDRAQQRGSCGNRAHLRYLSALELRYRRKSG